ncbi:MAG: hypothetical protein KKF46_00490 [Nanoarchaeota archaeon]|nr:hypothetical protein [Nanoarchaeota archaeon]MBU2440890.1 hypothetical protein [Nanoarchaeota archaeon]
MLAAYWNIGFFYNKSLANSYIRNHVGAKLSTWAKFQVTPSGNYMPLINKSSDIGNDLKKLQQYQEDWTPPVLRTSTWPVYVFKSTIDWTWHYIKKGANATWTGIKSAGNGIAVFFTGGGLGRLISKLVSWIPANFRVAIIGGFFAIIIMVCLVSRASKKKTPKPSKKTKSKKQKPLQSFLNTTPVDPTEDAQVSRIQTDEQPLEDEVKKT